MYRVHFGASIYSSSLCLYYLAILLDKILDQCCHSIDILLVVIVCHFKDSHDIAYLAGNSESGELQGYHGNNDTVMIQPRQTERRGKLADEVT